MVCVCLCLSVCEGKLDSVCLSGGLCRDWVCFCVGGRKGVCLRVCGGGGGSVSVCVCVLM